MLGSDVHAVSNLKVLVRLNTKNRFHASADNRVADAQLFNRDFTVGRQNQGALLETATTATRPRRGATEETSQYQREELVHEHSTRGSDAHAPLQLRVVNITRR